MSPRRASNGEEPGRFRRRALLLGVGALVVTAGIGALFGDRGYVQVRRYQERRDDLQRDIERLEAEVRTLHREILDLRQDPQAMERLAREELILARPGEVLFLYPREEAPAAPEGHSEAAETPDPPSVEPPSGDHLTGSAPPPIINDHSRRGVEQSGSSSGS